MAKLKGNERKVEKSKGLKAYFLQVSCYRKAQLLCQLFDMFDLMLVQEVDEKYNEHVKMSSCKTKTE